MSNFYSSKWTKPFLTPSIAVELLTKTPYHARIKCPYYGPVADKSSDEMNEGRVVDCLVLGGDPDVTVLDFENYRKKDAREAKKEAKNPILRGKYDDCVALAKEVRNQLKNSKYAIDMDNPHQGLITKQRLFWVDDGVHCSTEPDMHYKDINFDLKRTGIVPTVENWRRHASSMRYHIAVAAGLEATGARQFKWIIVEESTGLVVVHPASQLFIACGERDWNYAKAVWKNCVESEYFPAYESGEIDPTAWLIGDDREETNYAESDE